MICTRCNWESVDVDDEGVCSYCIIDELQEELDADMEEPDEDSQYTRWIDNIRNP